MLCCSEHCLLSSLHQLFTRYIKWRNLVKDNCFSIFKIGFLKPSWLQSKHYEKSTAQASLLHLKIFVWCVRRSTTKHIRDDVIIHWCLTPARLSATPRCISSLQQAQSFLLFKQTVDGLCLPIFRYTAAVDFIQQHVQTDSAHYLMPKVQ